VSPKIEAFLKLCETNRRGAILQLEHTLRGLQRQSPRSSEVVHRIDETQESLRALRANEHLVVGTLSFPPETGAIGRLPRLACHVDQILSEREMLVRCYFPVKVASVRQFRPRGETLMQAVAFTVRGVATQDFSEGADTETQQVFEITGRATYATVGGGSNTVWVLEAFDMSVAERTFRGQRATPSSDR
jgi:hypothetical protein